jgi:hypothetical protein
VSLLDIPAFVPQAGAARRVSLMGPVEVDELDPRLPKAMRRLRAKACPPLPPAPPPSQETDMPRVKRAANDTPPATDEAEPVRKKRGPKPGFKRKPKADKVAARLASTSSSEPNFVVDDAGRIAIIDGTTRIDLSIAATKRLVQFMDRTKSFRSREPPPGDGAPAAGLGVRRRASCRRVHEQLARDLLPE